MGCVLPKTEASPSRTSRYQMTLFASYNTMVCLPPWKWLLTSRTCPPFAPPSETIRLAKAGVNDRLISFEPPTEKRLIGRAAVNQTPAIVTKFRFRFRKNISGRCILIRPRLCAEALPASRALCPARGFWGPACGDIPGRATLFPRLTANSVNRQLGEIMSGLGYSVGRFPPPPRLPSWGYPRNTSGWAGHRYHY